MPALDGLRAVAVAAVLAFHGGVTWLPGGFLGVDAFFVLSGYLITTLLLREWQRTGAIAVLSFWGRRARRLLPALLLVVVAVMVGGRFLLPPEDLRPVRGDGWAALFYVANWRMIFRGGDYFTQTAAPSPLQHTWSLAIEEQFYLLLPLLLVAVLAGRRPTRHLLLVSGLLAGASAIGLGVTYQADDPGRAYYGTDTRASSLLIGVALATVLTPLGRGPLRPGDGLRRGLAMLALSGAVTTGWAWAALEGGDRRLYQGGMLAAALAVAAVIAHIALVPEGASARVLALPPLVALGRISYGVYLWHWPLFLAASGERTGQQGPMLLALRCLLTLAVATLSYLLVERPIRNRSVLRRGRTALPAAAGAVAAVAAVVLVSTSVPARPRGPLTAAAVDGIDQVTTAPTPTHRPAGHRTRASSTGAPTPSTHHVRPGEQVRLAVFGDSVAWSLVAYLPRHPDLDILDRTMLGCGVTRTAPYRYFGRTYARLLPKCRHWPRLWERAVDADNPDVALVLVGRWETMDRELDGRWRHVGDPVFDARLEKELSLAIGIAGSRGAKVLLATEPYNRRGEQPDGSLYPEDEPQRVTQWNRLLRRVAEAHPGVGVLDFGRRVSPDGRFSWTAGGVQVRADGLHLTPEGVEQWIAPWLVPRVLATVQP